MLTILFVILAACCAVYGFLIYLTASGTWFFMTWFGIAAVFVLFAFAAHAHLWAKLPGPAKALFLTVLIAGLAVFTLAEVTIVKEFGKEAPEGLDHLIVLGAQVREQGPSRVLRYRLDAACAYLRNNGETVCIVSGGQGSNEPCSEAEGMKTYLISCGISEERILTEPDSLNTKENIQNSMRLIDPETARVGIVTNNFHIYRGCAMARKAGIRHVSGVDAGSTPFYLPNNMLREGLCVIKDYLAGNI